MGKKKRGRDEIGELDNRVPEGERQQNESPLHAPTNPILLGFAIATKFLVPKEFNNWLFRNEEFNFHPWLY